MSQYAAICDLYDRIYSFKDYKGEADAVLEAVDRELGPSATSLLDVACGSGSHHPYFAHRFTEVAGLDLEPQFVAIARRKNPNGHYVTGDMCSFDIGRKFDVVTCLFSSIGYVRTEDRLRQAARCLAKHLRPSGLLILEPWFTPDQWRVGNVDIRESRGPEVSVVRMTHSSRVEDSSIIRGEYIIGTAKGLERRTDQHELGLFTTAQMRSALESAGLSVRHEMPGLTGRGLFLARAGAA